MGRLDGKVALITGGASGIGRAATLLFAREGARVMLATAHNEAAARETVQQVHAANGTAEFVLGDVTRADDARAMVGAALSAHGKLDVLVNSAGITVPGCLTHEVRETDWDRVLAVDLTGTFLMMKYAVPHMLRGAGGSIVNVSSVLALAGLPGCAAYAAAKAGIIGLTKTAAMEYAQRGIRVNALLPGFIWTPMHQVADPGAANPDAPPTSDYHAFVANTVEPMGRWGTAEEVAASALFLAADESSFVTGATLAVDGGLLAR